MTPATIALRVKERGRELGFDLVAIGPASPPDHAAAFEAWLDAGHAGSMAYLERGRDRMDPRRVLQGRGRSLPARWATSRERSPEARPG